MLAPWASSRIDFPSHWLSMLTSQCSGAPNSAAAQAVALAVLGVGLAVLEAGPTAPKVELVPAVVVARVQVAGPQYGADNLQATPSNSSMADKPMHLAAGVGPSAG